MCLHNKAAQGRKNGSKRVPTRPSSFNVMLKKKFRASSRAVNDSHQRRRQNKNNTSLEKYRTVNTDNRRNRLARTE